jgi:predicted RNA-binding Zn ribbon-like protein
MSRAMAMTTGTLTPLEARALEWIAPFSQAEHLVRARDYVIELAPEAPLAVRLAALTHDIERHFPGGPQQDFAHDDWDDPDYLFAHSTRSADIVERWLADSPEPPDRAFTRHVRRLILLHELGGDAEADLLQAADSLSFLETLQELVAGWVADERCSAEKADAKLRYMRNRIRIPEARRRADALYATAVARLPSD